MLFLVSCIDWTHFRLKSILWLVCRSATYTWHSTSISSIEIWWCFVTWARISLVSCGICPPWATLQLLFCLSPVSCPILNSSGLIFCSATRITIAASWMDSTLSVEPRATIFIESIFFKAVFCVDHIWLFYRRRWDRPSTKYTTWLSYWILYRR